MKKPHISATNSAPSRPSNKKTTPKKALPGLKIRQACVKILGAILGKKQSLDGLLDAQSGHALIKSLNEADRALCRAILQASLRHHKAIDKQLKTYLKNDLPAKADALRHLLHISAAQILYLNVPAHAAIHLAVESAKQDPRLRRFAGLVNAVLRQFSKEGEKFPLDALGFSSAPDWLESLLRQEYGKAQGLAILKALNTPQTLDLYVKKDTKEWAQKLNALPILPHTIRLIEHNKALPSLEGFKEGAWFVQNAASSLPARLFPELQGKKTADLCAAPGGKTAQLALLGAKVTAMDISETRLKRLQENMQRLHLDVSTWHGDFRRYPEKEVFDAILLDAPCSSTGTLRRHPDILWTKDVTDIKKLAELQYTLLEAAFTLAKKGAALVFSNCSLARAEGEEVVEKILRTHQDIALSPLSAKEFPQLKEFITKEGYLRTHLAHLPHEEPSLGGMDGFFAARFRKKI